MKELEQLKRCIGCWSQIGDTEIKCCSEVNFIQLRRSAASFIIINHVMMMRMRRQAIHVMSTDVLAPASLAIELHGQLPVPTLN